MPQDPWAEFRVGGPSRPQQPPGVIYGAPDPYKQANEQRAQQDQAMQGEQLRLSQEAARRAQIEFEQKQAKTTQSDPTDAVAKIEGVLDALAYAYADSNDNGGLGETGVTGSLMRNYGPSGSPAYDLAGQLKKIDAASAFDALQKMREASPTGGALGSVSDAELALLKATVANLDPNLSQQEFTRQLGIANGVYMAMLEKLDPAKAAERKKRGNPQIDAQGNIYYDERGREALEGMGQTPSDNGGVSVEGVMQRLGEGAGDLVEGAGDTLGLVTNPVGQLWYSALGYDQPYDTGQILRDATGLPQSDPNALSSQVNKFGASAMTGGLAARVAAPLLSPGTAQAVAQTLGRAPIRDTVAGAGAGAGSYAGRESGIPGGEYIGALGGGMLAYGGANAGFNAAMPRTPTPLGAASARQGVDMLPADAGGPVAKAVTTGTKASPLSVGPVVKAAQGNVDQMARRTRAIAEREGDIPTTDVAGEQIRGAAKGYAQGTRERFGRLYDKAHEAAGDIRIVPENTIAALDARIARLKADPSAPESAITEIQGFRDNIAQGVGVQGLRDARTRLSEGVYDGKIRSNVDSAAWKEILGNLSTDIESSLVKAGKNKAAVLFKRADEGWRARVEHIDEVLQPLVGRDGMKSGEDVLKAVETMARGGGGGNARLSRLLGEMSPEEAGQVRAVIIDRLGKAKPGAQDAAGEAFSPSTFLTNWNLMTPQARASLFSNTQLRRDLSDIATLAEGMKATQQMSNYSNTGAALVSNVGAGVAFAANHPVAVALGAGAQYLTGKLMASPGFARLLAKTSKMPPEVANRSFKEQLAVLAKNEPLIANDIGSLQQFLSSGSVTSAAAGNPQE